MIDPEVRARLVKDMERRRDELGKHWRQVAADGGISYETVRAARKGDGDIPAPTRRALERGLEWPVRHIDQKLGRPVSDVEDEEVVEAMASMRRLLVAARADVIRHQALRKMMADMLRDEARSERD